MVASKILVIGATGTIGKFLVKASVSLQHPTYVLLRPSTIPAKADLIQSFEDLGVIVLQGSLEDHGSLVAAIKQVDVVISAISAWEVIEQLKIVSAIKEVGTIKRFLPSEFGNDSDLHRPDRLEPYKIVSVPKVQIRRAIEAANIPHTYIASDWFAGFFVSNLCQLGQTLPPRDKVVIYGEGNVKAIFEAEEDIATYTIKTVDDPRTLNKIVYLRPHANILSQNELVALWEKKIGKTLQRFHLSKEEIEKQAKEAPFPENVYNAFIHSVLINGDHYNFQIGPNGVEACELYPEVKYTTVDDYLDKYV